MQNVDDEDDILDEDGKRHHSELKDKTLRTMKEMLAENTTKQSFHIATNFVPKHFAGLIAVNDAASSYEVFNELAKSKMNLKSSVNFLCSEYIRLSDNLNECITEYDKSSDMSWYALFSKQWNRRITVVDYLVPEIGELRIRNWMKDMSSDLEKLRENSAALEQQNVKLRSQVEELSAQLKECQDNFEEYRKHVHKSGGDTELGNINREH